MALPEPPQSWGNDEITRFIDCARNNEYATFARRRDEVRRLLDVDCAYRKAIEGLNHSRDWFAGFFLLRSHANWLGACRLCWAGQHPECYAILRSALENALYGLYLAQNPDSRETWLRRHDDEASKRRVRSEFRIPAMIELAKGLDQREGDVAEALYERTIDFGAHPNELALMQTLAINRDPEQIDFRVTYLEADSDQLTLALKTTAQVGVCALSLFRLVYRERFDILDITGALDHIKKRL